MTLTEPETEIVILALRHMEGALADQLDKPAYNQPDGAAWFAAAEIRGQLKALLKRIEATPVGEVVSLAKRKRAGAADG